MCVIIDSDAKPYTPEPESILFGRNHPKTSGINPALTGIIAFSSGINPVLTGIIAFSSGINPILTGINPFLTGINPILTGINPFRPEPFRNQSRFVRNQSRFVRNQSRSVGNKIVKSETRRDLVIVPRCLAYGNLYSGRVGY